MSTQTQVFETFEPVIPVVPSSASDGEKISPPRAVRLARRFERLLTAFEVVLDITVVFAGCWFSYELYHLLNIGRHVTYSAEAITWASLAFAGLFVLLLERNGAYSRASSLLRVRETETVLRTSVMSFLTLLVVTFLAASLISRSVVLIASAIIPIALLLEKQLMYSIVQVLYDRGYGVRRVLIYGGGITGRRVFSALMRSPKLGLMPVAVVDEDKSVAGEEMYELAYTRSRSVRVHSGPVTQKLLRDYDISTIIIANNGLQREDFVRVLRLAGSGNIDVAFVPSHTAPHDYWLQYADVDGVLLASFMHLERRTRYEIGKRVTDLAVGAAMMLLTLPAWLAIAVGIRLSSAGPVLFVQERVGKNGKTFKLYKFRTMYVDAPKYDYSPTESSDPRITPIGRYLRRTSIDELPQLLNVMKGEMSLVGPRPEMPFIVSEYTALHRQRLNVKPGITGLWQLSADRAYRIHENIQYDLYYIRNRGLFMDLAILIHTAVFAMRGI